MAGPRAFVGRRSELTRLVEFATSANGSSGRFLVVAGEAGVGKTRLVDELVASTAASLTTVVRCRADEHDTAAFGPWLDALEQLELPRPGTDRSVPSNEQRWEIVDLLTSALRAAGPSLVIVDDLHWADDDSLRVLEHLLDRPGDQRIAFVAATRPRSSARATRWHSLYPRAEVMALDGLDVDEVGILVEQFGGSPSHAHALWERTGGNPFFVREQVLAGGPTMPSTIEELLAAAIQSLGTEVADVLSVLALAGPGTPPAVLAAGCSSSLEELTRRVAAARRADILIDDEHSIRFRHDLLSEAAADRLGTEQQARVHGAIADAWAGFGTPEAAGRRARHLLSAVPAADATDAAESALGAAAELRASGRAADAADLLRTAATALEPRGDVDAVVKARIRLAEHDAYWALDDLDGAVRAGEAAAGHAVDAADTVLQAAAEVAALAHHNPFVPEPIRVDRLAELDDRLPDGYDAVDPVLRIRLRGRRAVLSMSVPDRLAEAAALGDDAVERARRLGDPEVLVGALRDRLFTVSEPEDYHAQEAAAAEIIDLARATGRSELALLGHQWTYAARVAAGDLSGGVAALDDLAVLAAIMPSPYWSYTAATRRSGVLALLGDYEGAIELASSSRELALGVVPGIEAIGVEAGIRRSIGLLYGRDDHGAEEAHRAFAEDLGDTPVLFLQACCACGDALLGDHESARRRLIPWLGRFDVALQGPEGVPALAMIATVTVLLGWTEAAPSLRELLRPFAGRMPVGNGVAIDLSADHHLAALALLSGDLAGAAPSARSAVEIARRMRSPALEARALALLADVNDHVGDDSAAASARDAAQTIAEPLGMSFPIGADHAVPRSNLVAGSESREAGRNVRLRLDHGRWFLESPFGDAHIADSTGMRQLVTLVAAPHSELTSVDLAGADAGVAVVASDLGPTLDARAKREYRQRIAELQADIDEAETNHDTERATAHRLEMDAILDELRAAVGLGGRDRPQGSSAERARINTTRNIRRAIAAIDAVLPNLAAHLRASIHTGHRCSYNPEPAAALTWHVSR